MASSSSSGPGPGPGPGPSPTTSTTSPASTDDTRDVIYKLLLAKLMESSSLTGLQPPPQPAATTATDANGLQHVGALGLAGSLMGSVGPPGGAGSIFSQFSTHQTYGGITNGFSPPSTAASSLFPTATTTVGYAGLPTTPTKDGSRLGLKRASPYAESHSPPAAPPHPAATAAGAFTTPPMALTSVSSPPTAADCSPGGGLPNFLLVKVTDIRSVERLQNLLALNGFTETRLVLASGESAPQPAAAAVTAAAAAALPAANYEEEMMMNMDQDPTLNAHHHGSSQQQLQHHQLQLLQGSSSEDRRDSFLLHQRAQHVPDVAATEEVADEEEYEENVEVVDDSLLAASGTAAPLAPPPPPPHPANFAQLSPPVNANEPPTDIQVAEVRHRSVSRSDGVDNEDVYVKCRLCENRIMNTRLSNLTNHVRRHAKLKQFQCAHCTYEHNEIFKVRTHMSRAHGDTASAPLDRRSPEMERQWEALMHACFPRNPLLHPQNGMGHKEHGIHSSASFSHPSSSSSNGDSSSSSSHLFTARASYSPGSSSVASKAAQHAARGRYSPTALTASPPGTYTCASCKESVAEDSLQSHIKEEHAALLTLMHFYICRECGFKSSLKDRVRIHAEHTHDVADIMQIPVESRPSLALQKLFPEKRVVTNEECEGTTHPPHHQPHDHHRIDDEDEEKEAGSTSNGGVQHTCRMCQRTLSSSQAAVTHAKKHYPTRQFHCTLCLYQAVDEAKVRAHLLMKHRATDLPINVVDPPMQRGWMDTMESCFPELANSTGAALIGTIAAADIGEDCESDTKRRKMERAAAAAAAAATTVSPTATRAAPATASLPPPTDGAISPSTRCHIVRATEAEEEEEIDVV